MGVFLGRKGGRMRCFLLKLINFIGIVCRIKEVNLVKFLECVKKILCV